MASAAPLTRPRVEASNTSLQGQEGDLPDFCLLGADYMLYGVYQDWVHQNTGYHLDGGISEDSKWKVQLKKLVRMLTQRYDAPSGKFRNRFLGILYVELDRVCDR